MTDLRNGELMDMLLSTPFADDVEIQCLSYAIKKTVGFILDCADGAMVQAGIDYVRENVLDALAVEMDVKWYDGTAAVGVKRALVKDSYIVHAHNGTKASVAKVVSDYYGDAEIEEWFEYGGDPGHFRVSVISGEQYITIPTEFLEMLEKVKRKSAVLDGVDFTWTTYQTENAGVGQKQTFTAPDIIMGGIA